MAIVVDCSACKPGVMTLYMRGLDPCDGVEHVHLLQAGGCTDWRCELCSGFRADLTNFDKEVRADDQK